MDFQQQYNHAREMNGRRIMDLVILRVLENQRRAKIKPSAMNPVLLNSPYTGGVFRKTGVTKAHNPFFD
jgi:hypothetical protein